MGQSYKEHQKSIMRVESLISQCTVNGVFDTEKAIAKAKRDSMKIDTEWKAIGRGKILVDKGLDSVAEVFLLRGHELGTDGQMEFRNYKLKKLNEFLDSLE